MWFDQNPNSFPDEPDNPLLMKWKESSLRGGFSTFMDRELCVKQYSWAIPTAKAVEFIKERSTKLVEIGAGRGYWASMLAAVGVDVFCYDPYPPNGEAVNQFHHNDNLSDRKVFHEVLKGGPNEVIKFPNRSLFLCWPPYGTSMAYDCLRQYRGNELFFIGEGSGGCTGDDQFFLLLEEEWDEIDTVEIPQWSGLHDYLFYYRRKSATNQ